MNGDCMGLTAGVVLDALVQSGDVIRKSDKTGRAWYSLASTDERVALARPATKERRTKAPPPSPLPADWKVSDELRKWARDAGCDDGMVNAYEGYFRDWAKGGSKVYVDWDATFRNCVRGDWGGVRKNYRPGAVAATMPGVIW